MMKTYYQFVSVLTILALLYLPPAFAQDEDVATGSELEQSDEADDAASTDQEVEINEDNYRQFMELKDAIPQRGVMPETAYKSQAQMQKLDKLPEESQKHLRNQLREIIVQGDPWKPGDEDADYPFTPSVAAEKSSSLQKQEIEAWGELVDSYHQREAQIYGNSSRSAAAAASDSPGGGQSNGPGNNGGDGGNDPNQGGQGQQAGKENSSGETASAGSYSPNSSNDQAEENTDGVSQNAMEFLNAQTGKGSSQQTANQNSQAGSGNNQQEESEEKAQNAMEFLNAQTGADSNQQTENQNSQAGSGSNKQEQSNEEAQNALEFLNTNSSTASNSNSAQNDPQVPENDKQVAVKQEDAQNALDYLNGSSAVNDPTTDADTISIKDLLNARGVSRSTRTAPPPVDGNSNKVPVDEPVDKDGGG